MATLQTVIDLAREPLNDELSDDADPRYTDEQLLVHVIHGLLLAYRNRYDLFMGGVTVPTTAMTAGSTFPLPDEFLQVFADYVTARAESRDDEFVISERAAQFGTLFASVVPG